jgi:hypothetical protein
VTFRTRIVEQVELFLDPGRAVDDQAGAIKSSIGLRSYQSAGGAGIDQLASKYWLIAECASTLRCCNQQLCAKLQVLLTGQAR